MAHFSRPDLPTDDERDTRPRFRVAPPDDPVARTPRRGMVASDWRPLEKGTLLGFFNLELASGLVLRGLTLHDQAGKRWVGLPGRAQVGEDGKQLVDPTTGKRLWLPTVEVKRHRREKFQSEALAAVDRMLAGRGP